MSLLVAEPEAKKRAARWRPSSTLFAGGSAPLSIDPFLDFAGPEAQTSGPRQEIVIPSSINRHVSKESTSYSENAGQQSPRLAARCH